MEGRLSPALQGPCGLTRDGAGPSDKAQVEGRAEQADTPRCHGQTHQWTWAGLDEGGVPPPWQGPSGRGLLPGPCLGPSEDKAPNSGHLKGRARKCVLQGSLHLAEPAPQGPRELKGPPRWRGWGGTPARMWQGRVGSGQLGGPQACGQLAPCCCPGLRFPICARTPRAPGRLGRPALLSEHPPGAASVGGAPKRERSGGQRWETGGVGQRHSSLPTRPPHPRQAGYVSAAWHPHGLQGAGRRRWHSAPSLLAPVCIEQMNV